MRKDIPVRFCKYALPQMPGLMFNSEYLIVDGVSIGNRPGRDAMAAAGVAVPVLEFPIALSVSATAGSSARPPRTFAEIRRYLKDIISRAGQFPFASPVLSHAPRRSLPGRGFFRKLRREP